MKREWTHCVAVPSRVTVLGRPEFVVVGLYESAERAAAARHRRQRTLGEARVYRRGNGRQASKLRYGDFIPLDAVEISTPETPTMPRQKKAETTAKPARTRKAKPAEQPAAGQTPAYTPKELELRQKYPHDILPQSYRVAGAPDREGWGKKHTVLVKCAMEGCTAAPRCVATSDLQFDTTRYCVACAKHIKANRRRTREVKQSLK